MILLLERCCDGFWAWPWPLIFAFLLGLLLGWLLKSIFGKKDNSCERCEELQAELESCRKNAKILTDNNKTISASLNNALAAKKEVKKEKVKAKKVSKKVAPKKVKTKKATTKKASTKKVAAVKKGSVKDDLTKVEGIGPKIQEHFNNGGIWTWKELAVTKISRLQEILDNAGPRYKMHNPGSWPKQAAMAEKGEWEKLKKWQNEHKRGIE